MPEDVKVADSSSGVPESVPYARFKEVNDKYNAAAKKLAEYEALGLEPQELDEALGMLYSIGTAVERGQLKLPDNLAAPTGPAPAANATGTTDAHKEMLRQALLQVFPELGELKTIQETQTKASRELQEARAAAASKRLKDIATKSGYDEASVKWLERAVAAAIADDHALFQRYQAGDLSVVDEVFSNYEQSIITPRARAVATTVKQTKDANRAQIPPRPPSEGAAPVGSKPPEKPKTIAEADVLAEERLRAVSSEPDESEESA